METADGPHGDSGSWLLIFFFSVRTVTWQNLQKRQKINPIFQMSWQRVLAANHRMHKNSATDFLKEQINQEMALYSRWSLLVFLWTDQELAKNGCERRIWSCAHFLKLVNQKTCIKTFIGEVCETNNVFALFSCSLWEHLCMWAKIVLHVLGEKNRKWKQMQNVTWLFKIKNNVKLSMDQNMNMLMWTMK